MEHELIMAGFGGQGIMSIGQLVTYAGMMEGKKVSWMPSYGPEQRGGTANCSVVVSDQPVGSPVVTRPTGAVIMNGPSLDKYEPLVKPGGVLVVNGSMTTRQPVRTDLRVIVLPANEIALELGNARVASMVALGALIAASGVVSMAAAKKALSKVLPAHRQNLIELNVQALERGAAYAQ